MIWTKRIVSSLILIITAVPLVHSQETGANSEEELMADLDDEQLVDNLAQSVGLAVKEASGKAVGLGYNLREMTLVVTQKGSKWEIYYKPREVRKRGGDLTILIGPTGSIELIERGQ